MVETRSPSIFTCRDGQALPGSGQRALFHLWNLLLLLLSSAGLCALSLLFAIGNHAWDVFFLYFRVPLVFLLNWLPVLGLQLLLYCLLNRQWAAYLITALLVLLPSIGDYFKIKFRAEPFTFRDVSSITAGLRVAGQYAVSLNGRILFAAALTLAGLVFLFFLGRGALDAKRRIGGALLVLLSVWPLWHFAYANEGLYWKNANATGYVGVLTEQERFIDNGFVYPFLYSITTSRDVPPEGYSDEAALEVLAPYTDGVIPADRRVNILVCQLESFTDLEAMGVSGLAPETYAGLRALQEESVTGVLVANVVGGGTINTERSFLSGSYGMLDYHADTASHVRWFADQGYFTTGSHPNRSDFYNRVNINRYLGFEEFLYLDDYYRPLTDGDWNCDAVFLPEVFRMFRDYAARGEVFSFNVSLQGHGPYESEELLYDAVYWPGDGASRGAFCVVNNYLGSLVGTQTVLLEQLETLRDDPAPAVVLIYGDHNPYLYAEGVSSVYEELGLSFDMGTEEGFLRYYGTPYLIWANDAAKAALGSDFTGQGPTVGPGYLMNVLFDRLGWTGSAFMQFTDTVMARLPVASNGLYLEDGVFTQQLSEEGAALLRNYGYAQFYLRKSYNQED